MRPLTTSILALLGGAAAGNAAGGAVQDQLVSSLKDSLQKDKIDDLRAWLMVKRHLGPHAQVVKVRGLNSAFYAKDKLGRPVVAYGPNFATRSIIAHEIGHGLSDAEGNLSYSLYGPSRAFGPGTAGLGAAMLAAKPMRKAGLGVMGLGALISSPHLLEEARASFKARKLLDGETEGLLPAWGTYANNALIAPGLTGAATYGAAKTLENPGPLKRLAQKALKFVKGAT